MKREIVVNASPLEVRLAVLESSQLAELYIERTERHSLVGNIYKGRVTRVLPGMQAAFVEVGLEKAGFLHVSDFRDDLEAFGVVAQEMGEEVESEPVSENDESESANRAPAPETAPAGGTRRRRRGRNRRGNDRSRPIEQQLRRGQEIIVQIAKEPMGTKGARLTSNISLPGRYLVHTPTSNRLGISRRIESAEERARLRDAVGEMRPAQGGFIIRTACEGVSRREIQRDIAFLTKLWASTLKKAETSGPESLLYSELDLPLRGVRDLLSADVDRLWCDDPATYGRIVQFVQEYMARLRSRVSLFDGDTPIFDHFGIEPQIERALDRKVWLKSGGYLVFDRAEALTAVDVNTGRFVGKRSHDETVLKTNLECIDELVRQLRLRNIGGIIVVDFIDMEREADRKRVNDALREALKRDKARAAMLKISELGLVQMTRKRTRESLEESMMVTCARCDGRKTVKSVATLAGEVLRGIHREAAKRRVTDMIVVGVSPDIARYLYDIGARALEALERRLGIRIVVRSKEGLEPGRFEVSQTPAAA